MLEKNSDGIIRIYLGLGVEAKDLSGVCYKLGKWRLKDMAVSSREVLTKATIELQSRK